MVQPGALPNDQNVGRACPLFKAMADHRMFGSGTENATVECSDMLT